MRPAAALGGALLLAASLSASLLTPKAAGAAPAPSAQALFLPAPPSRASADGRVEHTLQSIPSLSLAILSSRQGSYTPARMARDIESAARLAEAPPGRAGSLRVVRLPPGPVGLARLRMAALQRPPGELLIVLQSPRDRQGHELLWSAAAGLGPGGQTLTSQTTEQRGLIAAIDLAPTLLHHLRLPIPGAMRGKPIRVDGPLDGAWLRSLKARLEVVYPRRLPALTWLLAACGALALGAWLAPLRSIQPPRDARGGRLRWAIRVASLALLFSPVAMLLPAALEPSATGEYALIAGASLALGVLTDLLLPWPRAAIAPALAAVLAFSVDALAGSQLLIRSLLGPNPAYGSRFYGIGNELKSALAVLVFAAVAAALYQSSRSRRSAAAMGCAGALLAVVEGWARIGAGVGGVILVCAGTAVATIMVLPGDVRRTRALAAAVAAPLLGLALLAALDLTTAHGAGHYTGSVLDASSVGEVAELIARRYESAWEELGNGLMPFATALALLLAAAGMRYRERLLAPVRADPAWLAALAGGLTAGIVGALSEDSGPLLLVSAVSALACVGGYLLAAPTPRSPGTRPAAQSRARTPSAALAR